MSQYYIAKSHEAIISDEDFDKVQSLLKMKAPHMSLDFDENTPFLDDKLKKLNNKIKSLKKAIEDSAARQEKARQPEMLLSAKDLQIQEYDDALTARIIEKITVRSRNEIEIRFIGGYKKTMQLT